MGESRVLHCSCGATREVPIGLRIVGCVKCGRAMAQSSIAFTPTPPRSIVSTATLASQLLGTLAFAIALAWMVRGERLPVTLTLLVLGATSVFAGGNAHRGSISALAVCAVFDVAAAIACLGSISGAKAYVHVPLSWAAPSVANELATAMTITGVVAALAACACIAAVPQMRRLVAWRGEQILHAARVWRG